MTNDAESERLYQLAKELIAPQLESWLRELQTECGADAPKPEAEQAA